MAFVTGPALPSARTTRLSSTCTPMRMTSEPPAKMSRRSLLAAAAAAVSATVLPKIVRAEREYANVGYLGGSDKIDVNNANVRAYQKFRGFYPTLAGIIVSNGPYESIDEIYKLEGITDTMKKTLDEYKEQLVALEPAPEYVLDRINNGLYR